MKPIEQMISNAINIINDKLVDDRVDEGTVQLEARYDAYEAMEEACVLHYRTENEPDIQHADIISVEEL